MDFLPEPLYSILIFTLGYFVGLAVNELMRGGE
jgi:hypothetical protein